MTKTSVEDAIANISFARNYLGGDEIEVIISGTAVGYILVSEIVRDVDIRIKSAAIGGSTISLIAIDHNKGYIDSVRPIGINMDIMASLTSRTNQEISKLEFITDLEIFVFVRRDGGIFQKLYLENRMCLCFPLIK